MRRRGITRANPALHFYALLDPITERSTIYSITQSNLLHNYLRGYPQYFRPTSFLPPFISANRDLPQNPSFAFDFFAFGEAVYFCLVSLVLPLKH